MRAAGYLHPAFRVPGFAMKKAFSLVEILVVMAIIGLLSGLAALGFNSIGRGSAVRGAVDLAASMTLSARIEAMSFGHGSLLVIDNGTNTEHKLQRMAVFRSTDGTNYELAGKPTALPKGSFFLPEYSKGYETMDLPFPQGALTPVYSFKFLGNGQLQSIGEARLVFSGNVMDGSGNLQNPDALLQGRRGFILRKNGRPAFFQTLNQMLKNP